MEDGGSILWAPVLGKNTNLVSHHCDLGSIPAVVVFSPPLCKVFL